jgi:type I restriction enzyme S subunit
MEAYDLKDSGVDWLGSIPKHWSISQLKYVIEFHDNRRIPLNSEERGVMLEKSYDYYGASGVIDKVDNYIFDEPMILLGEDGANLITRSKPLAFIARGKYWVNNHAHILKPKRGNIEYWTYILENMEYSLYVTGAAQPKLSSMNLGKVKLVYVKDIEEQKAIADYLDKACQNIDKSITLKQQQLLNISEQYQSKIVEVIRKGLNRNIELKDSHSEWLGKVPNHWKVKSIKRVTEIIRGKFSHRPRNDPAFYNGDYPFIQTGNVTNAQKYITSYSQTLNEKGYAVSKEFPAGTLTMTIAANIADVAILDFNACFPDSIVGFKPLHMVSVEYLYYMFIGLREDFLSTAILTTQLNLNIVRVGTIKCAIPPKDEQTEIVSCLNELNQNTDTLKENIKSQIKTLTQYRQSLIHECVTGKKRIYQGTN